MEEVDCPVKNTRNAKVAKVDIEDKVTVSKNTALLLTSTPKSQKTPKNKVKNTINSPRSIHRTAKKLLNAAEDCWDIRNFLVDEKNTCSDDHDNDSSDLAMPLGDNVNNILTNRSANSSARLNSTSFYSCKNRGEEVCVNKTFELEQTLNWSASKENSTKDTNTSITLSSKGDIVNKESVNALGGVKANMATIELTQPSTYIAGDGGGGGIKQHLPITDGTKEDSRQDHKSRQGNNTAKHKEGEMETFPVPTGNN